MRSRSNVVNGWVILLLAILLAALAAGCRFPEDYPVETAPTGYREIVVECRDMIAQADAPEESALAQAAPGVVAIVTALAGADPLATIIAFMAGSTAIAAVEKGGEGLYETQIIRVPVADGQSAMVIRDASGGIVIITGGAPGGAGTSPNSADDLVADWLRREAPDFGVSPK